MNAGARFASAMFPRHARGGGFLLRAGIQIRERTPCTWRGMSGRFYLPPSRLSTSLGVNNRFGGMRQEGRGRSGRYGLRICGWRERFGIPLGKRFSAQRTWQASSGVRGLKPDSSGSRSSFNLFSQGAKSFLQLIEAYERALRILLLRETLPQEVIAIPYGSDALPRSLEA